MNGTEPNIVARFIYDVIVDSVPKGFFHPCPYIGEFVAYNVTLTEVPVFKQFLLGPYRFRMTVSDDFDDNILTVIFNFELL